MAKDWSRLEVEATVADYFAMWSKELAREPVNKREHNRTLQALLNNRSAGAIEFKHQNISAVLLELGLPYIEGYKPRSNYQDLLRQVIEDRLKADSSIEAEAAVAVVTPALTVPRSADWNSVVVSVPRLEDRVRKLYERAAAPRIFLKANYLERESRNASLGLAGERFVLDLEHRRLWSKGKKALAKKIEHVSQVRGDGLGYDIRSFEEDGKERLIEVKTTRYGPMTPFFVSRNELAFSEEVGPLFHLYRLFTFDLSPQMFVLPGALKGSVDLTPVSYRASLR